MMYDKNFLVSFSERALSNFEYYVNNKKMEEYDATLLICSFAGVLSIIDDEARKDIFKDTKIPYYINPISNYHKDKVIDNDKAELAIIRHMRNALCHFKLDGEHILANTDGEIQEIVFEDFYKKKCNFKCSLKIEELKEFFYFIINEILQKKK